MAFDIRPRERALPELLQRPSVPALAVQTIGQLPQQIAQIKQQQMQAQLGQLQLQQAQKQSQNIEEAAPGLHKFLKENGINLEGTPMAQVIQGFPAIDAIIRAKNLKDAGFTLDPITGMLVPVPREGGTITSKQGKLVEEQNALNKPKTTTKIVNSAGRQISYTIDSNNQIVGEPQDLGPSSEKSSVSSALKDKIFSPAFDASETYNLMKKQASEAELEKDPKLQAQKDVALLANHIKMTMGLVKGARITQAFVNEAQKARSIPDSLAVAYNKAVNGESLSPDQRAGMLNLSQNVKENAWIKSKARASALGITDFPSDPFEKNNPPPPSNADIQVQDSDGNIHLINPKNLGKAQQRAGKLGKTLKVLGP